MTVEASNWREITAKDFKRMGENSLVYIKPVTEDGAKAYALHSAAGDVLALLESHDAAVATALTNDLAPQRLQ